MGGFHTRWVVADEMPVETTDLDDHGRPRATAVERWIEAACDAYLTRCPTLTQMLERSGGVLRREPGIPQLHDWLDRQATVIVSAGVNEVWASAFRIAVRIRGGEAVIDATCVVSVAPAGGGQPIELGREVVDELIALEHAARHVN